LGAHWYAEAGQDSLVVQLLKLPTVEQLQQETQQHQPQKATQQDQPFYYYIDLAANNAYGFSNTFALDRLYHWNGLCIEANPK
jgi:hypothetical protein